MVGVRSGDVHPDGPFDAPPVGPPDAPPDVPSCAPPDDPPDDPPGVPFGERVADFYSPGVPLNRLRPRPRTTRVPADLLLRILEPPAVKVRHIPLVDLLRKPYRELGGD